MGNESQRVRESERERVCVCTRVSPDIPQFSVMECTLHTHKIIPQQYISKKVGKLVASYKLKNLSNGRYYLRLCVHHLHGDRKLTYPLVVERRESNFFSCAVFLFLGGGGDRK